MVDAFRWNGGYDHPLRSCYLVSQTMILSEGREIGVDDLELPSAVARGGERGKGPRRVASSPPRAESKAEYKESERQRILSALTACNWNRVKAAEMVGVPRRTFYRRLKEFGLL